MKALYLDMPYLTIPYLQDGNKRLWPIRPICTAIGITWQSQTNKFRPPRYHPVEIGWHLEGDKRHGTQLCLGQPEFEFWLRALNPNKLSRAARSNLQQLKAIVLDGREPEANTSSPPPTPTAILEAMIAWRMNNFEESRKGELKASIAREFEEAFGRDLYSGRAEQLERAIDALSFILVHLDKPAAPSVNVRLSTIISRIVTTVGFGTARASRADVAALMCVLELSELQSNN